MNNIIELAKGLALIASLGEQRGEAGFMTDHHKAIEESMEQVAVEVEKIMQEIIKEYAE